MSEVWSYRQRKMDIAWEIAKKAIDGQARRPNIGDDERHRITEDALRKAWSIVDGVFPAYDDDGRAESAN